MVVSVGLAVGLRRRRRPRRGGTRGRLCSNPRTAVLLHGLGDGVADRRGNGDAAVRFVFALDDEPRRFDRAGVAHRLFGGRDEAVVHAPVLPLLLRHAPSRERILLQLAQPPPLLILAKVHPELQDERAVGGERALELDDVIEPPVEVGFGAVAVDAIENRPRIPRAEEQPDAPFRRQIAPVAPVLRTLALFVRRVAERAGDDPPWIHPLAEQVHRLALAGAVDAGEDDDDREVRRARQPALNIEELLAELERLLLVISFLDLVSELRRFEHRSLLEYWDLGESQRQSAARLKPSPTTDDEFIQPAPAPPSASPPSHRPRDRPRGS